MDWIKKVFSKIKVLNSNFNSKLSNVNQNVNNEKKIENIKEYITLSIQKIYIKKMKN